MSQTIPGLIYRSILLIVLFPFWANAQTIVADKAAICAHDATLSLTGDASMVSKIEWLRDGTTLHKTAYREWGNPVVVAGTEGKSGNSYTELFMPMRIFVTNTGSVYVVDHGNGRVQRWDPPYTAGVTVASGLDWPEDVYVDLFGNVVVSEHWGKRVALWTNSTTSVTIINVGAGADGISVDALGNLYVAHYAAHRIQMHSTPWASSPTVVKAGITNQAGNQPNQLRYPIDVHTDLLGNMWVIDEENGRLMYFPNYSVEGFPGQVLASNLSFSRGSSVWRDVFGNVFFTSVGGAYMLAVGETQPRKVIDWARYGIQGDLQGNLFVTDFSASCVKKLTPSVDAAFQPTEPGWYVAKVTYLDGQVKYSNWIEVMPSISEPTYTHPEVACQGTSITLKGTSGHAGYVWRGPGGFYQEGANVTINNVSPSHSGVFSVQAKGSNGCLSPAKNFNITVLNTLNPSVTISPDAGTNVFCDGSTVSFTATPADAGHNPGDEAYHQYQWMLNGNPAGTGPAFSSTGLNDGDVVQCTFTSTAMCVSPTPVTSNAITMYVSPEASLDPGPVCAGSQLTVNTQANVATVEWYYNAALQSSGTSGTLTAADAGTYHAVVTSQEGCVSTTNSVVVNANYTPAVNIAATATEICAGSPVTFTANVSNAGTNPVLAWSRNGQVETTSNQYTPATLQQGDVISCLVTVAADAGCVTSNTAQSNNITMTVNALPAMQPITSATNQLVVCDQGTLQLQNATIRQSAVWKSLDPATAVVDAAGKLTALQAGIASVRFIATTAAGCTDSTDVTITINGLPVMQPITAAGNSFEVCALSSVLLSNATVRQSHTWKSLMPTIATIDNNGLVHALASGSAPVRFTATNSYGCTDSIDATIIVHALPVMQPIKSVTNSFTVCEQSTLQLQNSTVRQTAVWKSLEPGVAVVDAAGKLSALQGGTATIRFIATNAAGCTDSTETPVTVIPLVTPYVTVNVSANPVCENAEVTFTAQQANGGPSPQYKWLINGIAAGGNSNTFSSRSLQDGDEVICQLTSNAACPSTPVVHSNPVRMQINPLPRLSLSAERMTIVKGDAVQLQATATGTIGTVQWTPAASLDNATLLNPIGRPQVTTKYRLTVTSQEGCTSADDITIEVVDRFLIPNVFSPNGDGINDRWEIEHLEKFPGATVQIFNRYGQLVYQTSSYQRGKGWDGHMNGQPLPMGAYYYIIDLKNGRPKLTGSVTILK